jgi:hypothetical protein
MRLLTIGAVALLATAALPVAVSAESGTTPDEASAPAAKAPKAKKICRESPPMTGSRLPQRKICKTEKEWTDLANRDIEMNYTPGARAVPPPPKAGPGR